MQTTTTYEQTWVDGLNRGDVSVADKVFAADCVIHINGSPNRNLDVAGFKARTDEHRHREQPARVARAAVHHCAWQGGLRAEQRAFVEAAIETVRPAA